MTMFPIYKLGEISKIYNGNSINAEEKERKYRGVDGRDYIGTKDIDFDCSVNYNNGVKIPCDEMKFKIAPAGSVLVCAEGGSAGKKSAYITKDVCFGNKLFAITNNQNLFEGKYVFYYTRYKQFFDLFKNELSGLIGGVSSKKFGEIPIPLPPLPTQHAIVSRIESLFAELDKAEEHLRTAQQQLKIYRQAVLNHWLTSGCESWKKVTIGDIVERVEYGSSAKSQKTGRVPVLRMGNIQNGRFDWSDLVYSDEDEEIKKYLLNKDDVLFNRTNSPELVGKTAIYKGERPAIFAGYLIRLHRKEDLINADFLNYYLNSDIAKNYGNTVKSDGVNQSNINGQKLKTYPLFLPPIPEQQRIVKEIESRLSQTEATEARIAESLQQTEALRQSILKKAFSGELV